MIKKGYKIQATCFYKFMRVSLNGSCDFLMHSSNDKKLKGKIVKFVFLLTRALLWDGAVTDMCSALLPQGGDAKRWPWLAPQDLPPHSEPLLLLGMTFPALSTHPRVTSRRGAARGIAHIFMPGYCLFQFVLKAKRGECCGLVTFKQNHQQQKKQTIKNPPNPLVLQRLYSDLWQPLAFVVTKG